MTPHRAPHIPANTDLPLDPQLYLASASPRRRELLASVGLRFAVLTAAVDERPRSGEAPDQLVVRLASAKAGSVAAEVDRRRYPRRPVLGADTCVIIDDELLGKPADAAQAAAMIGRLSGRRHEVLTAIALHHNGAELTDVSRSHVRFKALTDNEIARYCATPEPLDKAGAYAIQGLASGFVEHLEGSYTGVVGLPMFELRTLLRQVSIDWL